MKTRKQRLSKKLWKASKGHCVYCAQFTEKDQRTVDHMIPVSKGGSLGANLLPACKPCNARRGANQWPPHAIAAPDFKAFVIEREISLSVHMRNRTLKAP